MYDEHVGFSWSVFYANVSVFAAAVGNAFVPGGALKNSSCLSRNHTMTTLGQRLFLIVSENL